MNKKNGFSLIELMVTLVILGVIISIASPSMSQYFGQKTLPSAGKLFNKALLLARSEALQRGSVVQILPRSGNDWASGWLIQFENDLVTPSVMEVIRVFDALPSGTIITSSDFSSTDPIVIQPSGQAAKTGSFDMNLSNCRGGLQLRYELLISGTFNRQVLSCQ